MEFFQLREDRIVAGPAGAKLVRAAGDAARSAVVRIALCIDAEARTAREGHAARVRGVAGDPRGCLGAGVDRCLPVLRRARTGRSAGLVTRGAAAAVDEGQSTETRCDESETEARGHANWVESHAGLHEQLASRASCARKGQRLFLDEGSVRRKCVTTSPRLRWQIASRVANCHRSFARKGRSSGLFWWHRRCMNARMRVLLVYPEFPTTYWGFQHSLELVGRRATLPPLGLISVAALLPQDWEFRLVDMNVEGLRRDDIRWADVVLSSGMLVQEPSMHAIVSQARELGKRTVVGGPACTTSPERFSDADCLFLGEAEGRVLELVAAIEGKDTPAVLPAPAVRPSLHEAPVPRFDLLDVQHYRSMAIQTS